MTRLIQSLDQWQGREVVLDMVSPYVFLGTLTAADERHVVLEDADVHDLRDTTTTRELYVLDARRHGISANRKRVLVSRDQVVSMSLLEDALA